MNADAFLDEFIHKYVFLLNLCCQQNHCPSFQKKEIYMRTNIKNFSYQNSSVEEFFTDKYNLEFNYKVKQQIETMCPKMLPNSRKLGFVKVDTSKYRSPIRITSLQFFNLFYHECSIGNAENESLKHSRLALCQSTAAILEKGLELLGIPTPERM